MKWWLIGQVVAAVAYAIIHIVYSTKAGQPKLWEVLFWSFYVTLGISPILYIHILADRGINCD